MLSKRLLDYRRLGPALPSRFRPRGQNDVLLQLDGQRLLRHVLMVPEAEGLPVTVSCEAPTLDRGVATPWCCRPRMPTS